MRAGRFLSVLTAFILVMVGSPATRADDWCSAISEGTGHFYVIFFKDEEFVFPLSLGASAHGPGGGYGNWSLAIESITVTFGWESPGHQLPGGRIHPALTPQDDTAYEGIWRYVEAHVPDELGTSYSVFVNVTGHADYGAPFQCGWTHRSQVTTRQAAHAVFDLQASASPTSGPSPLKVSFSVNAESEPSPWPGHVPSGGVNWTFGDGFYAPRPTPVHLYAQPGTYEALVEVMEDGQGHVLGNGGGYRHTKAFTITVLSPGSQTSGIEDKNNEADSPGGPVPSPSAGSPPSRPTVPAWDLLGMLAAVSIALATRPRRRNQ